MDDYWPWLLVVLVVVAVAHRRLAPARPQRAPSGCAAIVGPGFGTLTCTVAWWA
jgi:hypothetical protein